MKEPLNSIDPQGRQKIIDPRTGKSVKINRLTGTDLNQIKRQ
jgi:hypothetical protein